MSKENNSVIVKYKTHRGICRCCNQNLPEPITSEVREFEFSNSTVLGWGGWKEVIEFEDDLDECVREFVYETISFFATMIEDEIIIEDDEFDKVKQLILNTIK